MSNKIFEQKFKNNCIVLFSINNFVKCTFYITINVLLVVCKIPDTSLKGMWTFIMYDITTKTFRKIKDMVQYTFV